MSAVKDWGLKNLVDDVVGLGFERVRVGSRGAECRQEHTHQCGWEVFGRENCAFDGGTSARDDTGDCEGGGGFAGQDKAFRHARAFASEPDHDEVVKGGAEACAHWQGVEAADL